MKRMTGRVGWAICGAIALALVATFARVIQAGPLDPPGPVGSTMKTIGDLVPAWHQTLTSNGCGSTRWSCVMSNAAVLDNETGLVWEMTPSNASSLDWLSAGQVCDQAQTGGRMGWRLPTAEELLTIHDPSTYQLPASNPFLGANGFNFWSSTSAPGDEASARYVGFNFSSASATANKHDDGVAGAWCVRGQHGQDFATQSDGSWSKELSANSNAEPCNTERFQCALGDQAVLDHETGLVWARNLSAFALQQWSGAVDSCAHLIVNTKAGWRLPTVAELSSLLDTTIVNPAPSLPAGHPFQNPVQAPHWTSTLDPASGSPSYFVVDFFGASSGSPGSVGTDGATSQARVLCVRGSVTH
jgi:hypothetical protein